MSNFKLNRKASSGFPNFSALREEAKNWDIRSLVEREEKVYVSYKDRLMEYASANFETYRLAFLNKYFTQTERGIQLKTYAGKVDLLFALVEVMPHLQDEELVELRDMVWDEKFFPDCAYSAQMMLGHWANRNMRRVAVELIYGL